ncbi:hypothetical protein VPHK409_0020 [Vibrio phage K409]
MPLLQDGYPAESGLYEVRYQGSKHWSVWYFRNKKLSYSDSQWVVQHGETAVYTGYSWQGKLPYEWRCVA